jgi:hypothetical protein
MTLSITCSLLTKAPDQPTQFAFPLTIPGPARIHSLTIDINKPRPNNNHLSHSISVVASTRSLTLNNFSQLTSLSLFRQNNVPAHILDTTTEFEQLASLVNLRSLCWLLSRLDGPQCMVLGNITTLTNLRVSTSFEYVSYLPPSLIHLAVNASSKPPITTTTITRSGSWQRLLSRKYLRSLLLPGYVVSHDEFIDITHGLQLLETLRLGWIDMPGDKSTYLADVCVCV